jgi:hypothetical protein
VNPAGRNIRSVWEIATQPYHEAHFATFPEALAERCIKAGCPEQVCGTCGAPRTRLTSSRSLDRNELPRDHPEWRPARYDNGKAGDPQSPGPGQRFSDVTMLGWSDCGHNNYRPGVVLDQFMGSGTVALVARNQRRRSVGIELNEEYARLCARRLQQLSLLSQEVS